MLRRLLCGALAAAASAELYPRYGCRPGHDHYPFCDLRLPLEQRVEDLISRLTLDEKPLLLVARESPKGNVSRLGVPQYDWGTNCAHGVQSRCGRGSDGRPRCPTPFPNPNHLGASFNETLWRGMASIMGRELRSLWRQGVGEDHPPTQLPPLGLDCWSPNINVVRDPRWGRNVETPSEDPFLLGRYGVAVTKGLQEGEDARYLQAVVTLKHFVANELEGTWPGPGGPARYPGTGLCPGGKCTRHTIDPNISAYDLASTYLPPFKASVQEGGALGVMCSYNSVNGVPSCANGWLLRQKLRREWGFKGYVTGDTGAVKDIFNTHRYVPSMAHAVAAAVSAGTDVQSAPFAKHRPFATSGEYIKRIPPLVRAGNLSEEAVDAALRHTLALRFRLGLFDPPEGQPYEHVPPDVVRSAGHVAAAVEAAEQGLVLLQNRAVESQGGAPALPLRRGSRVALVGPHATSRRALLGNYLGQACPGLTPEGEEQFGCVESLAEALGNLTEVVVAPGLEGVSSRDERLFGEALRAARGAEHVVLALGLDGSLEAEGKDRRTWRLPEGQQRLFQAVRQAGRPVTVVLLNGGAISAQALKDQAAAVVEAWYPGFFGARAVAKALMGLSNRWGKLPVTVYAESFERDLDMLDWDMSKAPGRTYRYHTGAPLWPFGFGLSYTSFGLRLLSRPAARLPQKGGRAELRLEVRNAGDAAGDEVVMAYFSPAGGTLPRGCLASRLREQLFAFRRVSLAAGAAAAVAFELTAESLALFSDAGDRVSYAGGYSVRLSNGLESLSVPVHVDGGGAPQPLVYERWAAPAGGPQAPRLLEDAVVV